eukprot:6186460-Pleurochrysis_carterae.AAC.1
MLDVAKKIPPPKEKATKLATSSDWIIKKAGRNGGEKAGVQSRKEGKEVGGDDGAGAGQARII